MPMRRAAAPTCGHTTLMLRASMQRDERRHERCSSTDSTRLLMPIAVCVATRNRSQRRPISDLCSPQHPVRRAPRTAPIRHTRTQRAVTRLSLQILLTYAHTNAT